MRKSILVTWFALSALGVFLVPSPITQTAQAAGVGAPQIIALSQHDTSRPLRELVAYPATLGIPNGQALAPRSAAVDKHPSFSSNEQDRAIDTGGGESGEG